MEDSIQENTKFLQNEGKKERFIVKSSISGEIFTKNCHFYNLFENKAIRSSMPMHGVKGDFRHLIHRKSVRVPLERGPLFFWKSLESNSKIRGQKITYLPVCFRIMFFGLRDFEALYPLFI